MRCFLYRHYRIIIFTNRKSFIVLFCSCLKVIYSEWFFSCAKNPEKIVKQLSRHSLHLKNSTENFEESEQALSNPSHFYVIF